jgi:DNA-binding MarR family transcriptional regulator
MIEKNLLHQVGKTGRAMHAAFEETVGIALPRWRIMLAIHQNGESAQKDLAAFLSMDPGLLTRQLKQMEIEGIVKRKSALEDNRITRVQLTAKGTGMVEAAQPLRQSFFEKALEGLPTDKLCAAMDILETLEARFRR